MTSDEKPDYISDETQTQFEELSEGKDRIPPVWKGDVIAARYTKGHLLCVRQFIYTAGLHTHVDIDESSIDFKERFCYETAIEAITAMCKWTPDSDPPGNWIKEKMSERLGPGAIND